MAKKRVYEVAKELEIPSKDVLAYLNEQGIEAKSASSGLDDAQQSLVLAHFSKSAASGEENKEEKKAKKAVAKTPEEVSEKSSDSAEETKKNKEVSTDAKKTAKEPSEKKTEGEKSSENRPKKKPKISAVFNPQYSKSSNNRPRRDGDRDRTRRDGDNRNNRRPNESGRPNGGRISIRPESERSVRPSHRVAEEQEARRQKERNERQRQEGRKEQTSERGERSQKEYQNRDDRRPRSNRDGENRSNRGDDRRRNAPASAAVAPGEIKKETRRDEGRNKKKKQYDQNNNTRKQERYVNLEKNGGKKRGKPTGPKAPERDMNEVLTITLPERIVIKDLADKMKVQPSALVKTLFLKGMMVTVNQEVDFDQAEEIALEFNCICEPEEKIDVIEELLKEEEEDAKDLVARPPVVCVMGHVDHGKTSLLDAIRDTKVTDREAGGITQHIGAYMVSVGDRKITFLDTPGHEAFTAMRMRGANSTDIAILVVAADDGVMPQTVEAINHAKAAGIEIIVAINKIDKPNANVERVKQELSEYELIPEDWGGSTVFVPVSAHTHEGIDELLDMILLTADVLELKANPKRNARGLVIEARLDKGRGTVATVLVQKGTLHVGDPISAGSSFGKVRAMMDENGHQIKVATPSTPVEILGLSDVPNAGEIFIAHESEKDARTFADTFVAEGKNRLLEETKAKMSLDDLFSQIQSGNVKELDIIVKADVQGSVEAVRQSLVKLSNDEVVVKVIHGGVGAINESDVVLASASNAIIIGFNVRPDAQAKATAEREGVDVRLYKVIYNAIEDVEAAMKGMLDPIFEEQIIGHAQVRQIFKASDVGNIAGSYVLDGYFARNCKVRVSREGEQIFEGELASLKRFKDDVKEVKAGFECGLVIEGFGDFAEDDMIEAYIMVEVPR